MSTNDTLRGLLPCPFCGDNHPLLSKYRNADPVGTLIGYVWRVECENCGANTCLGIERTEEQAVSTWNCRAPLPAVEAAEIEVVAWLTTDGRQLIFEGVLDRSQLVGAQELMTVAQHRRILAGVNQQAGSGWVACADRMPESGRTVLAYYLNSFGNDRRIRAQHVKAWTILAEDYADPDIECVEYSEQEDAYYLLEGWYECIDNWDEYYRVQVNEGPITHWQPLPPSPAAKADSNE